MSFKKRFQDRTVINIGLSDLLIYQLSPMYSKTEIRPSEDAQARMRP